MSRSKGVDQKTELVVALREGEEPLVSEEEKDYLKKCLVEPHTQDDVSRLLNWAVGVRVDEVLLEFALRGLVEIQPTNPLRFRLSEVGTALLRSSNFEEAARLLFEDEDGHPKADTDTQ